MGMLGFFFLQQETEVELERTLDRVLRGQTERRRAGRPLSGAAEEGAGAAGLSFAGLTARRRRHSQHCRQAHAIFLRILVTPFCLVSFSHCAWGPTSLTALGAPPPSAAASRAALSGG